MNMHHKIVINMQKEAIEVDHAANLLETLREKGFAPAAPCGGQGKCGKCVVWVNGEKKLACKTIVCSDLSVEIPQYSGTRILTSGQETAVCLSPVREGFSAAFDIGTTTVVCYLLSPEGRECAVESMLNPQYAYGADVISRIQQALAGRMTELTRILRSGMMELIQKCCRTTGIQPEEIQVISVVGNPCMQQFFLGIPLSNLASIPFAPMLTKAEIRSAEPYLPICPQASLLVVPDISGYVGADTMGCVLATGIDKTEETVLMVDIGTNGEMVLVSGGRMAACSTAAGPALEGANIQFGMRGEEGAIDHVWEEDGRIQCSVIGGGEAVGICGSGIIDAVAVSLEQKRLNRRGRILTEEERDGQRVLLLSGEIYLSQNDIRQVQMAKGAIAAGIRILCQYFNIAVEEIDRVILAGAFGSFLNPENAQRIGLLPEELSGKISSAGNAAGTGAKMMARSKACFEESQSLLRQIQFVELAEHPDFRKTFAKSMNFRE